LDEFEDDEGEDNFDPSDTEDDIEDDFDPNDTEEDIEDDFDPNDTEEDIDDDFDPNDTEEDVDDEFDPNDTEEEIDDDFDPNDTEKEIEDDFDPNDTEEDKFNDKFNPSEETQYHNENIGSQSTSTVLTNKIEEIEGNVGQQEQEEEIEIRSEEYQNDTEPIVNSDEIEFIKDIEELAEQARKINAEDENIEPQTEKENAAYYAEQYYEALKEKEVVSVSKEGQETEELRQEVTEELNSDQESGHNSDNLEEEEDIIEASKITSTEEFEYLWEIRDKLEQEGKISEEIEEVMHEAEKMYETLKDAEKLYEEQQQEKLKLVDHEDEASEEDLKEDLDREDLLEQTVELEEKLVQQGVSQKEIDIKVEESIETTKFEEKLENIIEEQEREKLKLVDHEDEASEEDLKEELDRIDLVEQAVELEEKLVQQGESQEEIDARVEESIEESIETTKFEEKLEKIIEEQEREKLKLVDHEDEASEEDLKENLDRIDLIEQAVELEEKLVQQGELQEEIDVRVEESIETTKFEEKLEKIIEEQEREKLMLVDHEDEASEEDLKEDLDRIDLVEQAVELEENLVQQGESQEDIDIRVEESIEEALEEKEVETYGSVENKENLEVLKPELDAESESEYKKDLIEESTKLVSEESDEEENERLQELYRQETGRRPIYSRKITKGYSQWLEQQRELGSEKIKYSKSESEKKKEIEEEGWKTTLIQWIKEASEEECNAELKSELKKALESYNEFEDLTRKFLELYKKSQKEKLTEIEKNRLKFLTERLQELGPIQLELVANIRAFKDYFYNHFWELMNRFFVNRVRSKFFKHISQTILKLKELRKEQKNEKIKYLVNKNSIKKSQRGIDYNNEDFRKELKKKFKIVVRNILNRYDLKPLDEKTLINCAFNLFDYAVTNKNLKSNDLGRNKGIRYLSIILIYYALIGLDCYTLGNRILTGKLVAQSVEDYSELGFKTRETMEGHITAGKLYKFLPREIQAKTDNLPYFKKLIFDDNYRNMLIQYLEIAIPELLNSYSILELKSENIKKTALKIFDYAINNGMTQDKLFPSYNSNKMALILIFYGLLDLGIKSLGFTSISQSNIGKALKNIYNKLNFPDADSIIYLSPKVIYNFLPEKLKTSLNSLPSPKLIIFTDSYKEALKNFLIIISKDVIIKYSFSGITKNELVNRSLKIFGQALDNGLLPDNLNKNRSPNKLAIILLYFALIYYKIYNLRKRTICINAVIDSLNDISKLGFNSKKSMNTIYFGDLLPFLPKFYETRVNGLGDAHKISIKYDNSFKKDLEKYIRFISSKIMKQILINSISSEIITKKALQIYEYALKNGLNPDKLGDRRFARYISVCLVYFSLVSLDIKSLGNRAISVRDISNIIGDDYEKLGFGSIEAMKFGYGFLKKFIHKDISDIVENLPSTIGIIFNREYFINLEKNINIIGTKVIEYYNLEFDLKKITSKAIHIFQDSIHNGLEPSDMGDNKNTSFMSIILIYYALISFNITRLQSGSITVSKIIDSLVDHYDRIGFSSLWFSDRVISGRLYNFLPQNTKEIVDLLPERDRPAGKYESICKQAFNEVFSDIFNMKIRFTPHLSLYKLVENHRIKYINEYIQRGHSDGAVKIFLQKKSIINAFRHKLRTDIDIPRDIDELLYVINDFNSFQIQKIVDRIKDNLVESDSKVIKFQFPIGYIKILIENNKIFLLEREVNIPFNYHSENFIWITFEYNGIQHYIFPNYFNKNINELDSFLKGVINDLLKIYLLYHNGIIIFEFPYWICPKMNRPNRIKDFIKNEVNSFFNF